MRVSKWAIAGLFLLCATAAFADNDTDDDKDDMDLDDWSAMSANSQNATALVSQLTTTLGANFSAIAGNASTWGQFLIMSDDNDDDEDIFHWISSGAAGNSSSMYMYAGNVSQWEQQALGLIASWTGINTTKALNRYANVSTTIDAAIQNALKGVDAGKWMDDDYDFAKLDDSIQEELAEVSEAYLYIVTAIDLIINSNVITDAGLNQTIVAELTYFKAQVSALISGAASFLNESSSDIAKQIEAKLKQVNETTSALLKDANVTEVVNLAWAYLVRGIHTFENMTISVLRDCDVVADLITAFARNDSSSPLLKELIGTSLSVDALQNTFSNIYKNMSALAAQSASSVPAECNPDYLDDIDADDWSASASDFSSWFNKCSSSIPMLLAAEIDDWGSSWASIAENLGDSLDDVVSDGGINCASWLDDADVLDIDTDRDGDDKDDFWN